MKNGKVFENLRANKKVESIEINEDGAQVTLKPGFKSAGNSTFLCANAKEANTFIRAAQKADEPVSESAMKTVRNLMTGTDIEIPVGTPRCCDPSTELYWSM